MGPGRRGLPKLKAGGIIKSSIPRALINMAKNMVIFIVGVSGRCRDSVSDLFREMPNTLLYRVLWLGKFENGSDHSS